MNGLSWNCRGIGNSRTVRVLHVLIKDRNPAFVFLIETLSTAGRMEELRIKFDFDNYFSMDYVGHSGGLAVLWKNQV